MIQVGGFRSCPHFRQNRKSKQLLMQQEWELTTLAAKYFFVLIICFTSTVNVGNSGAEGVQETRAEGAMAANLYQCEIR